MTDVGKVGATGADYQFSKAKEQSPQFKEEALFQADFDLEDMGDGFSSGPYKNFPAKNRDAAAGLESSAKGHVEDKLYELVDQGALFIEEGEADLTKSLPAYIKKKYNEFPNPADYDIGKQNNYTQWSKDVTAWEDTMLALLNNLGEKTIRAQMDANTDYLAQKIDNNTVYLSDKIDENTEYLSQHIDVDYEVLSEELQCTAQEIQERIAELSKKLGKSTAQILKAIQQAANGLHEHVDAAIFFNQVEHAITRGVVLDEGDYTRDVVRDEGEQTRAEVRDEGDYTREVVRAEGMRTREEVRDEGRKTRKEIDNATAYSPTNPLDPRNIRRGVRRILGFN